MEYGADTGEQPISVPHAWCQDIERLPDRVLLYTNDGEAAVAAAHERGLQPEQVLVRRSSLEDVFLRLTGRSLIE